MVVDAGRSSGSRLFQAITAEDADVKPPALPSGVRILPLRSVLTFDGATAITGDSAGRVHAWPIGIAR